jgi:hypothetical protein
LLLLLSLLSLVEVSVLALLESEREFLDEELKGKKVRGYDREGERG